MDPTPPHAIPVVVQTSRSLAPGRLELTIASTRDTGSAALADPSAVILSVNDGSGWREPARQLPPGWSLDTYRVKASKPRADVRGAGRDSAGRNWYYVHLASEERPEEYQQRKRAWADDDRRRRERNAKRRAIP
jgi:hypothetical protein